MLVAMLPILTTNLVGNLAWNTTWSSEILGYAQASYCRAGLETWECGDVCSGLPHLANVSVVLDAKNNGLAFVGYAKELESIVVSFRGTQGTSFHNWWSDLSSIRLVETTLCSSTKNCMVGGGFLEAYQALRDGIFRAIQDLRVQHPVHLTQARQKIIVTGHSLGAALCNLAVVDMLQTFKEAPIAYNVVTFGSPRTGNQYWVRFFNSTVLEGSVQYHYRVTHYRDPIIHLPPFTGVITGASGFWHTAREVFLPEPVFTGNFTVCDNSGEDSRCSSSLIPEPTTKYHLNYLGRHLGTYAC